MGLRNTEAGWGWPARLLHWAMAGLIVAMLTLGLYMTRFEPDLVARYGLTQTHKSLGFLVFVLALSRIGWRLANRRSPAPPATMPGWERRAARTVHAALYALMLAVPLSGWLYASASPLNDPGAVPFRIPNMVFGLFEMPDPFPTGSERLATVIGTVHGALALALAALAALHVAAALKHHLLDGDRVMARMIRG